MKIFRRKFQILICIFAVMLCSMHIGGYYSAYADNTDLVFIGGEIIGFEIDVGGAIVIGIEDGSIGDWRFVNKLQKGDIIESINGLKVNCADDIHEILNSGEDVGVVKVELNRRGEHISADMAPYFDAKSATYKLGISVKDTVNGLGTATFVTLDGRIKALGHEIVDSETGIVIESNSGRFISADVTGILKGSNGRPGTIKGYLTNKKLGMIDHCGKFGLSGMLGVELGKDKLYSVSGRGAVRTGKAQICTSIGGRKEFYDIQIIRAFTQSSPQSKSMIIKVTDERLIALTGGIVQGMSGSPIIQNNAIVGAVTHVFVNDSLMGYGIYADWLL